MIDNKTFFQLLRLGLGTEKAGEDMSAGFLALEGRAKSDKAWKNMLRFGAKQGVAAIMLDGLQKLMDSETVSLEFLPSSDIKIAWANHAIQVEKRWHKHEAVIEKLARFYSGHDIRMMVLKGYGLSLLYPKPEHRPCGDIDIWLFGEQERGDKLLNKEKGIEIDEDHHHHTVFYVDDVMIENHYDFLNIESHLSNREIERILQVLAKQPCEEVSVNRVEIFLPPVDFNALFLLRHAGAHFAAEEITLRHVTDWALFVLHYHKDIDWKRLEDTARKQNMHKFLHCINGICVDYIGVLEEVFPKFERDMDLEKRMMQNIISPDFQDKSALKSNLLKNFLFRFRRWWGNRWKHRMVYREGLLLTFLVQVRSHLMKSGEWK